MHSAFSSALTVRSTTDFSRRSAGSLSLLGRFRLVVVVVVVVGMRVPAGGDGGGDNDVQ